MVRWTRQARTIADEDLERWHIRIAPYTWIGDQSVYRRRRAGRQVTGFRAYRERLQQHRFACGSSMERASG